jgi:hypothetical protein
MSVHSTVANCLTAQFSQLTIELPKICGETGQIPTKISSWLGSETLISSPLFFRHRLNTRVGWLHGTFRNACVERG